MVAINLTQSVHCRAFANVIFVYDVDPHMALGALRHSQKGGAAFASFMLPFVVGDSSVVPHVIAKRSSAHLRKTKGTKLKDNSAHLRKKDHRVERDAKTTKHRTTERAAGRVILLLSLRVQGLSSCPELPLPCNTQHHK